MSFLEWIEWHCNGYNRNEKWIYQYFSLFNSFVYLLWADSIAYFNDLVRLFTEIENQFHTQIQFTEQKKNGDQLTKTQNKYIILKHKQQSHTHIWICVYFVSKFLPLFFNPKFSSLQRVLRWIVFNFPFLFVSLLFSCVFLCSRGLSSP